MSLPTSPRSTATPGPCLSPNFMFSFLLLCFNPSSMVYAACRLLNTGPSLEHGGCTLKGKWLSLPQWLSVANNFLGRGGVSPLALLLPAGMWSDLCLHRSYACCHSHWEFRRASAPLWGKTRFLQPSISSGSYALLFPSLNWSLILGRKECSTDVSFLAEHSDASCSLHLDQLEVAVLVVIYCKNETKQDENRLSRGPMIYYCTQKWVCLLVVIRGFS